MTLKKITVAALLAFFTIAPAFADWKEEADRRIEQHRKENVSIHVTVDGKPVSGAEVSLKLVDHEFLFGCNIFKWGRCRTPKENELYLGAFDDLFNFATLGFYWWAYEPKPDEPQYSYSQQVADWCKEKGVQTKGHPLAWNFIDPPWAKDVDEHELYHRQMGRNFDCARRFSGLIDVWDVVNEATAWDREDCRKNAPHLTSIMEQYDPIAFTKSCFEAARDGNPKAKLLINDYMTGKEYVELIEKLVDSDGKPLYDIIGIQSHMHSASWSNEQLWDTCERFAGFGVPLHFTELTVLSGSIPFDWSNQKPIPTTPEGEQKQKDEVERIYTMLFSHPSVEAITWWDFSDQGAWMHAPAGLVRTDMTAKPAYDALKKLVRETWTTDVALKTDAQGETTARAFRGTYQVEITLPNGKNARFPARIEKGENNLTFDLKP